MLSRAGLGDDAPLAHPARKERLTERVVDLVSAGVEQILALQINPGAATMPRQLLREIERRGPAGVVAQLLSQFGLERRIRLGRRVGRAEFLQRGHQRLRHKHSAIGAEVARRIRQGETVQRFGGLGGGTHGMDNVASASPPGNGELAPGWNS